MTKQDCIKAKLNDLKNELVAWLNDECPHATMTFDLSHTFAECLRIRLDEITITRGELSALESEPEEELFRKVYDAKFVDWCIDNVTYNNRFAQYELWDDNLRREITFLTRDELYDYWKTLTPQK